MQFKIISLFVSSQNRCQCSLYRHTADGCLKNAPIEMENSTLKQSLSVIKEDLKGNCAELITMTYDARGE